MKLMYSIFCNTELDYDVAKALSIKHNFEYITEDANSNFDVIKHLNNVICVLSGSISGREEHPNFQKVRRIFFSAGKVTDLTKYGMYEADELINQYLK